MTFWICVKSRLSRLPLGLRLAAAALLSALLARVTVYPFTFWPGALVTYLPLLVVTSGRGSLFSAMAFFLAAFVANGFGFYFVASAIVHVAHQSWLAALLLFLGFLTWQALPFALVGLLLPRHPTARMLLFGPLLACCESVIPICAPWFTASLTQASLPLSQLAAVDRGWWLSAGIGAANAGLAYAVLQKRWEPLVIVSAGLTAAFVFGLHRLTLHEHLSPQSQEPLRLGVVQGSYSAGSSRSEQTLEHYALRSRRLFRDQQNIDLLVWPEASSVVPLSTQRDAGSSLLGPGLTSGRRRGLHLPAPVLFGSPYAEADYSLYNSALLLDRSGRLLQRYDKQILFPIGEKPLTAAGAVWVPAVTTFAPGSGTSVLQFQDWTFQVAICLEDLFNSRPRGPSAVAPADFLLAIGSDAWFDDPKAAELHLQLSRFRAIESGKYLVRVMNRGVSALIDPTGRVVRRLEPNESSAMIVDVPDLSYPVFSLGLSSPLFAWVSMSMLLLGRVGYWANSRRNRTSRKDGQPPGCDCRGT